MTAPLVKRGDMVEKFGGRYGGPGRVIGETDEIDLNGYRLYNVAMKVEGGYGEFVHVFPASVLRPLCICHPADKGHAYGKITMGCPVHAVPVDNALFNLPGDPHQDGGGDGK